MASIRQLKSGKWNVQIRKAGKKAVSRTFTSKAKAEAWAEKCESGSKAQPAAKPTWREMGYQYCDQVLA